VLKFDNYNKHLFLFLNLMTDFLWYTIWCTHFCLVSNHLIIISKHQVTYLTMSRNKWRWEG